MRIGYADPPYIGCAHLYADQPSYAGEVDHLALVARLGHLGQEVPTARRDGEELIRHAR